MPEPKPGHPANQQDLDFLAGAGTALREAIEKIKRLPAVERRTDLALQALISVAADFAQRYTGHTADTFAMLAAESWALAASVAQRPGASGLTPVGLHDARRFREPFPWQGSAYEVEVPNLLRLAAMRAALTASVGVEPPPAMLGIVVMAWGLYEKGERVYRDEHAQLMLADPDLKPEVVEMAEAVWKRIEPLTKPAPLIVTPGDARR